MDSYTGIRRELDRELADSAAPPLGELVADGLARGRKLRSRRRLAVAVTAAATTLAVVSAGTLLASSLGGTSAAPFGPAASATTPAPKEVHHTEQPVSRPPIVVPPGHKLTTGQAVVALLIQLLPRRGDVSEVDFSYPNSYQTEGVVSGGFVFDDGHGKASVSAGIADHPANYGGDPTTMACPTDTSPGFVCEHIDRPDGVEFRIVTMGPYPTNCKQQKCSLKDVRVEVKRQDGLYVTAEAYNGPFGYGRGATRTDTLFSVQQLLSIATYPRWGFTIEASFVDTAAKTVHRS